MNTVSPFYPVRGAAAAVVAYAVAVPRSFATHKVR